MAAWPAGTSWPGNSVLNAYTAGLPVANAAVVPTGTGSYAGEINVYVTNATDVLIDINGYYVSGDIGNYNTALGTGAVGVYELLRLLQHGSRLSRGECPGRDDLEHR